MGTYSSARGAVEAIGGSMDWDEPCPDAPWRTRGVLLGISGPETTASLRRHGVTTGAL